MTVKTDRLFKLTKYADLPNLAIKVSLAGVMPLPPLTTWSKEAVNLFRDCIEIESGLQFLATPAGRR